MPEQIPADGWRSPVFGAAFHLPPPGGEIWKSAKIAPSTIPRQAKSGAPACPPLSSGRPERASQGDTDDRRILQKGRLLDVFLGKMASWRQAGFLPDRARLRRDEKPSQRNTQASIPTATPPSGSIRGSLPTTRTSRRTTSASLTCLSGKASPGNRRRRLRISTYDYLADFDVRQADYAVEYIKKHAKDEKPFFMDVNFMKMHNPTNANKAFAGKSRLGDYSDSVMELDADIGKVMDAIRAEAPNTIVIVTADNGAWQDAYPDAGTTPSAIACTRVQPHNDLRLTGGGRRRVRPRVERSRLRGVT